MQFAKAYPLLYRLLQPAFPSCLWSGSQDAKEIALTFDDGPSADYTPSLLSVLDRYDIRCSFFWLGVNVDRSPSLAKEVYQRGHGIGLHGYHHRSFPRLRPEELKESLEKTQGAIARACQISPHSIRDVRPPNGFFTPKTLQLLHAWEYRPVMWSVVPEDWVHPGVKVVTQRVLHQVQNGSLIVLHDGYYGGRDVATTVAVLVPHLLDLGYSFVSVEEMWQQRTKQSN